MYKSIQNRAFQASLLVCGVLSSTFVLASLSSSVKVRVTSSSNYVYPCNAGIAQNPKASSQGLDSISSSWVASQNNLAATADSGVAVGGLTKNNNPDTDYTVISGLIGTASRPYLSFNQLLPENKMYDYVIGQNLNGAGIQVNMESDTYDSGFYVTFCFKPSLITSDQRVPMSMKFVHAVATHAVVPGSPYNYATDSGLMSMVEIKCTKTNGTVVQHYTPNGVTAINNLLTPFPGNARIDMAPSDGIQIGSGNSLIFGPALQSGEIPDDCRVRFYFVETSGKVRQHQVGASDIQVDLQATIGTL